MSAPGRRGLAGRLRALQAAFLLQPPAVLALEVAGLFLCALLLLTVPLQQAAAARAKAQVDEALAQLAMAAAATVDGDLHETLREPGQESGEAHARLQDGLVRLQNAVPGIYGLYTLRPVDGELQVVLDTARSPALERPADPPSRIGELLEFDTTGEPGFLPAVLSGRAYIDSRAYDAGGTRRPMRTVSAPVRDAGGRVVAILSIDYEEGDYAQALAQRQRVVLGLALVADALLVVAIGLLVWWLRSRIGAALRSLAHASRTDGLTGLGNRRYFNACLGQEVAAARAGGRPLSVLVFDADHFKRVNDTHGHPAGDAVLVHIARCVREGAKRPWRGFRIGGEEFALLLPGAGAAEALQLFHRLSEAIRRPVEVPGAMLEVTVSAGIAELGRGREEGTELLARADQALYVAKNGGRDFAVVAAPA